MSDDLVSRLESCAKDCTMLGDEVDAALFNEAATALTEARAEIERLRSDVYVPGQWRCAKCKFTLQQMNLNANTGTVTARDDAGDKCPNCNSPLWRVTWKQDAHEMLDRATEQMGRAKAAESELSTLRARVREVVEPFAEAAADLDDTDKDSTDIWEAPCAMQITLGHLRAARQLMEEVK